MSGEWIDVVNPSTGEQLARIARGGEADVCLAIAAAQQAFEQHWRTLSPADRSRRLLRFASVIEKHAEELAQLESEDVGKPLSLARKEINVLARNFEFYGGAADKIHGETIPFGTEDVVLLLREPVGVTGFIVPWNGPAVVFGRTVAASLAAGNTCVLKPAEDASLSILRLAELSLEAGIPPGVLNVVTGYGVEAGAALSAHGGLAHLSFTGSPEVGTAVQIAAARNHVPVTLELGGKSPNIVFADADIDKAVEAITAGIIINSGQVCAAGSRVLIERPIYEEVVARLQDRFSKLRVGNATEDLDLGPLISAKQLGRVRGYIERAVTDRITIAAQGELSVGASSGGFFQSPTLLRDVPPDHALAQEEIFGPVLVAISFEDEEDAVQIANGTPYGLVAGVWTENGARQFRMAQNIRAGQVYINAFLAGAGVELPFGGSGKSGHGREKGLEALRSLTKTKTVVFRNRRAG